MLLNSSCAIISGNLLKIFICLDNILLEGPTLKSCTNPFFNGHGREMHYRHNSSSEFVPRLTCLEL